MTTHALPSRQIPPHLSSLFARIRTLATRPGRTAQQAFFLEGPRAFIQAHDAHFHFQAIVYSPILLHGDCADMLARRLHHTGIPRLRLSPEQFRTISRTARASGIGAIARQRWAPLPATPHPGLCHLVIEHIRAPGNLGTILRTAHATGVASVIFVGQLSDPYDPAAVRATMGSLFHVPLIRTSHAHFAHWLRTHKIQLVGLSPDAPALWTSLPPLASHCTLFTPPGTPANPTPPQLTHLTQLTHPTPPRPHARLALALGDERKGLSPFLRSLCTSTVKLPMAPTCDSLNVSLATAVMLYELLRPRPRP